MRGRFVVFWFSLFNYCWYVKGFYVGSFVVAATLTPNVWEIDPPASEMDEDTIDEELGVLIWDYYGLYDDEDGLLSKEGTRAPAPLFSCSRLVKLGLKVVDPDPKAVGGFGIVVLRPDPVPYLAYAPVGGKRLPPKLGFSLICLLSQSIICWLESRLFYASSNFCFIIFICVLISLISASFLSLSLLSSKIPLPCSSICSCLCYICCSCCITTAFLTLIFCFIAFFSYFIFSMARWAPSTSAFITCSFSCIFAVFARSSAKACSTYSLAEQVASKSRVCLEVSLVKRSSFS